ncbi:MAG TPA: TonB-dependent receptor [Thermoanaerobaculia bacterium]|nr:TonB-dependent receptor [Thermoanaerobaculia bacterium]
MPHGGRSFASLIIACLLVCAPAGAQQLAVGMPLTDALLVLQARGLKLVFSSRVVRPEMRVAAAPVSTDPRSILDEILAPHGLTAEEQQGGSLVIVPARRPPVRPTLRGLVRSREALTAVPGASVSVLGTGVETRTDSEGRFEIEGLQPGTYILEARRPGFVIDQRQDVVLMPGSGVDVAFLLQPAPLTTEEITVQPSRISLLYEEPVAPLALSRDEILGLPHLGGDVFRAVSLLPGTTANDVTAQFHVRGGRRDEVQVLLDGQELYEAYHLKDFDNALSIVPTSALARLVLATGAFPSSYGDRMGAILEMSTLTPSQPRRFRVSLSVLDAQLESAGKLGERLGWLVSARRGTTDLAGRIFGQEDPGFWDVFAKVDDQLTPRRSVRANGLHSADRLGFTEERHGEIRRLDTEYDSSYLWLTHQAVLSDRLFVDTALSTSRIDRDRRGSEDEEEKEFEVRDGRDLAVAGLLQSWNFQAGPRHFLKSGFELRRFDADYDYFSFRAFESLFRELRAEPRAGLFTLRDEFQDEYFGAYLSDRFHPADALTLELGARYDRHTLTGDSDWSPRANLAWGLGSSSVLRVGWGHYHQSQRAYELMVGDGDTRFYPAERSEHWVAGVEHLFGSEASRPPLAVRAEIYRRRVTDPRPRYESLFEPLEPFPEGELDRFRIEPESGTAEGVELFVQGRAGSRLDWWVNYGYATTDDVIAGKRIPRQIDQRHTLNLDVNVQLGHQWDLNLAWRFHTGWPTTPVFVREVEGDDGEPELAPALGPLNSERLPEYHRLDLRVSRRWQLSRGRLTLFLDAQNLYNRRNVAGYDLEFDEESGQIIVREEPWPGFFASAGVSLEF